MPNHPPEVMALKTRPNHSGDVHKVLTMEKMNRRNFMGAVAAGCRTPQGAAGVSQVGLQCGDSVVTM